MIRLLLVFALLFASGTGYGQDAAMADGLRADGKIYVVIAVIAIIFVCLALLIAYFERKISRLEKELKGK
jgi:hypothetical protein